MLETLGLKSRSRDIRRNNISEYRRARRKKRQRCRAPTPIHLGPRLVSAEDNALFRSGGESPSGKSRFGIAAAGARAFPGSSTNNAITTIMTRRIAKRIKAGCEMQATIFNRDNKIIKKSNSKLLKSVYSYLRYH